MPPYWGDYDEGGGGGQETTGYMTTEQIDAAARDIFEDRFGRFVRERRPRWLSNKILTIVIILVFLLGLGFLIAGSIMLGIGVSKSHTKSITCPLVSAAPYYATVESTKLTWDDVLSDYTNAANVVAEQVRASLLSGQQKAAAFLDEQANKDPYITVLGLSKSNQRGVMAVVGMAYTTQDAPSNQTMINDLLQGDDLNLYHVSSSTASNSQQQMCNQVSVYQAPIGQSTATPSNGATTLGLTPTQSTVASTTMSQCVCPTVTACPNEGSTSSTGQPSPPSTSSPSTGPSLSTQMSAGTTSPTPSISGSTSALSTVSSETSSSSSPSPSTVVTQSTTQPTVQSSSQTSSQATSPSTQKTDTSPTSQPSTVSSGSSTAQPSTSQTTSPSYTVTRRASGSSISSSQSTSASPATMGTSQSTVTSSPGISTSPSSTIAQSTSGLTSASTSPSTQSTATQGTSQSSTTSFSPTTQSTTLTVSSSSASTVTQGTSQTVTSTPGTSPSFPSAATQSTSGSTFSSSQSTSPSAPGTRQSTSSSSIPSTAANPQSTSQEPSASSLITGQSTVSSQGTTGSTSQETSSMPSTMGMTTTQSTTTTSQETSASSLSTDQSTVSSQGTTGSTSQETSSMPSTMGMTTTQSTTTISQETSASSLSTDQSTVSSQGTTGSTSQETSSMPSTMGMTTTQSTTTISQETSASSLSTDQSTVSSQGTTGSTSQETSSMPSTMGMTTTQSTTTISQETSASSLSTDQSTVSSQGTTGSTSQETSSMPSTMGMTTTQSTTTISQETSASSLSTDQSTVSSQGTTGSTSQETSSMPSTMGMTTTQSTTTISQETSASSLSTDQSTVSSQGTTGSTSQETSSMPSTMGTATTQSTTITSQGTSAVQSTTTSRLTTTPSTPPTTQACVPVITPSPRPGARDVVILIDDSIAMVNATNYNQIITWLGKTLCPMWPVNQDRWEAAPAQFAQFEFNLLMDFDANSIGELVKSISSSVYNGRRAPSLTKAMKSTLNLAGREGVHRTVLCISSSANLPDLETAVPLSEQIKSQGIDIITLALGGLDQEILGILSSGPDYTFGTADFAPSADQATQITDLIQSGSRTTHVGTTEAATTTTSGGTDFPCHPDIAIVVDTSLDVSSQEEYQRQLSFIGDQLAFSWLISPTAVETEIVVYTTSYGGTLGSNNYAYSSSSDFQSVVHEYDGYWNRFGQPNITASLTFLSTTVGNRRVGRSPTTILFTYSGNENDVTTARNSIAALGNLIVVGMGSRIDYLTLLTGNVITGLGYGNDLVTKINSLLCSPSTPAPLPTTSVPSTVITTVPTTTTTMSTMGTTATPQNCPDCNPDEANVLIAMDTSSLMKGGNLDLLKSFINGPLTSNWTHSERLAVLGFDDRTHFSALIDFGDLTTMSEYHKIISAVPQLQNLPSLTSAFQHCLQNYNPLPKFGAQKTIIFTISADPQDTSNAKLFADQLSRRGTVVLVGMNMTDVSKLRTLVPSVIAWPNLSDSTGIAEQIEMGLAGAFRNSTTMPLPTSTTVTSQSSGTGSTPSGSPSSSVTTVITSHATSIVPSLVTTTNGMTTTPGTTTLFTASPAVCSRDVILLIDQSNDYVSVDSFNKVKSWLIKFLVPLWEVSPQYISVAPFAFANRTFNDLGGDFLVQSQAELVTLLQNNLQYKTSAGPNIHSALRKSTSIKTRPGAATVLISASDNADDVNQAIDSAKQLKQNGGTVITLAVGPNTSGHLGKLSSGLDFTFYSSDFAVSSTIAMDISDVLCSSTPTTTAATTTTNLLSSSTVMTTTTTAQHPFACNPDVAFLFDSSGIDSNEDVFNQTVWYVADRLISNWIVDDENTESAIVVGNALIAINDQDSWRYRNREELQQALLNMGHDYFGGDASISLLFKQLQSDTFDRRGFAPLVAVLFTFSSDYKDVVSTIDTVTQLGVNVISVGLGSSDSNILGLLSGNIVSGQSLDDQLTSWINSAVCNPKPPISTPTTAGASTPTSIGSTSITSSSTAASTTTVTTTTVKAEGCPDCYPALSNILILVDAGNDISDFAFGNQKTVVSSLIRNWTHFERVALSSYSNALAQMVNYDDLKQDDHTAMQILVSHIKQTNNTVDLGKSLHQATSIQPDPLYGIQKTILFTASEVVDDKTNQAGAYLRSEGQMIVVGIGMADVNGLGVLASPQSAIPWADVSDTSTVVQQILTLLANGTIPVPSTTVSTTTVGTTTPGSTATASCSKDVLLLIDVSDAYGSQQNFNLTRNWVVNSLIPMWNISPSKIFVLAAGFANKTWNNLGGGDFGDIQSVAELQLLLNTQIAYRSDRGPNLAYCLTRAVGVSQPDMVTVLISASENPNSINDAYPMALKLKEYGSAVITLSLGTNAKGFLGTLSSGANFSFVSTDYTPSTAIASSISSLICGPEPIFTTTPLLTTTQNVPSTITPPAPFSCKPDVAFLFDSATANSSDAILASVMTYVSDSLISNWIIDAFDTEGAVVQATSVTSIPDRDSWHYRNREEFRDEIRRMSQDGTFIIGSPSVEGLLSALQSLSQTRRQSAPLVAVMFTFSTNYDDVVSALPAASELGANIVSIGLGSSDQGALGLLTGNVLIPTGALDDSVTQFINQAVCNPKDPLSSPTTSELVPTSSTIISTTAQTTTIWVVPSSTTVFPEGCPDCYPPMANILLMLDNSANQTADTLQNQKAAVSSLVANWTHFERVSLASFAGQLSPILNYNDARDLATFLKVLGTIQQSAQAANLGKALHGATGVIPISDFGTQQTIVFTTTFDNSDKAKNSSGVLQGEGQLIMIGVAMADASALRSLASPGGAIAWSNTSDTQSVVSNIMTDLGNPTMPSRGPSTSMGSGVTTAGSTTPMGNVCPRGLIVLLDDSTAFPTDDEFSELKTWISGTFFVIFPDSILVNPIVYDNHTFNEISGGSFLPAASIQPMLRDMYQYTSNGPNISRALQKAGHIQAPDGSISTLLISASAHTDDVAQAGPYANILKEKGGLVTLLVGTSGDGLLPLASSPGLSFSTTDWEPSIDLTNFILAAVCSNPATLTTPVQTSTTLQSTSMPVVTTTASQTTTVASTSSSTSTVITTNKEWTPTTTVTLPTTTVTPEGCPDCVPVMANLLLLIDNSANQTADTLQNQKVAVSSLVANWTHFERVSLASFAGQLSPILNYNDVRDLATFLKVLGTIEQSAQAANLGKALHGATGVIPVPEYGKQQTILFTTTVDNSDKAKNSSSILQGEGQLIMIGVAMADSSALRSLASPGGAIAWSNTSDTQSVVGDITGDLTNPVTLPTGTTMIGMGTSTVSNSRTTGSATTPVVQSTTVASSRAVTVGTTIEQSSGSTSPVATTSTSTFGTTAGISTSAASSPTPIPCSNYLILLLDDSTSIRDDDSFAQLKNWTVQKLLSSIPGSISIDAISYDNKQFSDMNGGSFLSGSETAILVNYQFFHTKNTANISKALQKASSLPTPDGAVATLLVSASSDPNDVTNAAQFSTALKQNGALLTLLIGSQGNGLSSLSSGSGYSFSSISYVPDDILLYQLVNALCPGMTTTVPTTSATKSTTAQTTSSGMTTGSRGSSSGTSQINRMSTGMTISTGSTITEITQSMPLGTTTTYPCPNDLILLLDDSVAVSDDGFAQLKNWTVQKLLSSIPSSISIDVISYDNKQFSDMNGGSFLPSSDTATLVNYQYFHTKNAANISKALQKAGAIQAPDGTVATLLISASSDAQDVANAEQYANILKQNGALLTLLVGAQGNGLFPLASGSGYSFSSSSYSLDDGLLYQLINAICPGTQTTTMRPVQTTTTQKTTVFPIQSTVPVATTTVAPCPKDLILLLDDSTSITDQNAFNQLKNWTVLNLLPRLPGSILIDAIVYDDKQFNDLNGGSFLSTSDTATMVHYQYFYSNNSPNISKALQKASFIQAPDSLVSTLIISSNPDAQDVANAGQYASILKQNGALLTLLVGSQGDELLPLASGSGYSFSSTSYAPNDAVLNQLLNTICPGSVTTLNPPASSRRTSATTTGGPVTSSTPTVSTTTSSPCPSDLILLLDDSVAVSEDGFSQLKNWTMQILLTAIPGATLTDAIAYDNKQFSDMNGGSFLSVSETATLVNYQYFHTKNSANISKALQKAGGIQSSDGTVATLLISASAQPDDVTNAGQYAEILKQKGPLLTLLVGSQGNGLLSLASGSGYSFSSASYAPGNDVLTALLGAICGNPSTVSGTIISSDSTVTRPSMTPAVTTVPTTTAKTTTVSPCPNDLILLLDDSISIPDDNSFNKLKNWTVQKLLTTIPGSISIDAISYDNKQFSDMNGGFLPSSDTATLVNYQYFHTKNAANISKALQKAGAIQAPDGTVATLLISASSDAQDVANAEQYANILKQNGALLTLLVGSQGDELLPLASGSGFSFSSASFAPGDDILNALVTAICTTPGTGPTTTGVSTQSGVTPSLPPSSSSSLSTTSPSTVDSSTPTVAFTASKFSPVTTTAMARCPDDVILLLDDSTAIQNDQLFNKFKLWILDNLLTKMPKPMEVDAIAYAKNLYSDLTAGFLPSSTAAAVLDASYQLSQNGPNITTALKKAGSIQPDGSVATLLISASAQTDDVTSAGQYATVLKSEGALVTLLIGAQGDGLSALSSGAGFSFSVDYAGLDDTLADKLLEAICTTPVSGRTTSQPSTATTIDSKTTVTNGPSTGTTLSTSTGGTTEGPVTTGRTFTLPSTSAPSTATSTSTGTTSQSTKGVTTTVKTTASSTIISSTTVTTTTFPTTTAQPYIPTQSDILFIFDVSSSVTGNMIGAEGDLISRVISNWTHPERVGVLLYSDSPKDFQLLGQIGSFDDLQGYLSMLGFVNPGGAQNMDAAFQDVIQHYPLQSDMTVRNVVLFTGSSDYTIINAALASANTVKTLGKLITVGIQLPNINPLYKIASPNSVVAFNDFNDMSATVDQINQMLI